MTILNATAAQSLPNREELPSDGGGNSRPPSLLSKSLLRTVPGQNRESMSFVLASPSAVGTSFEISRDNGNTWKKGGLLQKITCWGTPRGSISSAELNKRINKASKNDPSGYSLSCYRAAFNDAKQAGVIEPQQLDWLINTVAKKDSRGEIMGSQHYRQVFDLQNKQPMTTFESACIAESGLIHVGERRPDGTVHYDHVVYVHVTNGKVYLYQANGSDFLLTINDGENSGKYNNIGSNTSKSHYRHRMEHKTINRFNSYFEQQPSKESSQPVFVFTPASEIRETYASQSRSKETSDDSNSRAINTGRLGGSSNVSFTSPQSPIAGSSSRPVRVKDILAWPSSFNHNHLRASEFSMFVQEHKIDPQSFLKYVDATLPGAPYTDLGQRIVELATATRNPDLSLTADAFLERGSGVSGGLRGGSSADTENHRGDAYPNTLESMHRARRGSDASSDASSDDEEETGTLSLNVPREPRPDYGYEEVNQEIKERQLMCDLTQSVASKVVELTGKLDQLPNPDRKNIQQQTNDLRQTVQSVPQGSQVRHLNQLIDTAKLLLNPENTTELAQVVQDKDQLKLHVMPVIKEAKSKSIVFMATKNPGYAVPLAKSLANSLHQTTVNLLQNSENPSRLSQDLANTLKESGLLQQLAEHRGVQCLHPFVDTLCVLIPQLLREKNPAVNLSDIKVFVRDAQKGKKREISLEKALITEPLIGKYAPLSQTMPAWRTDVDQERTRTQLQKIVECHPKVTERAIQGEKNAAEDQQRIAELRRQDQLKREKTKAESWQSLGRWAAGVELGYQDRQHAHQKLRSEIEARWSANYHARMGQYEADRKTQGQAFAAGIASLAKLADQDSQRSHARRKKEFDAALNHPATQKSNFSEIRGEELIRGMANRVLENLQTQLEKCLPTGEMSPELEEKLNVASALAHKLEVVENKLFEQAGQRLERALIDSEIEWMLFEQMVDRVAPVPDREVNDLMRKLMNEVQVEASFSSTEALLVNLPNVPTHNPPRITKKENRHQLVSDFSKS